MGKPIDLPEQSRKVTQPYAFTYCPYCGDKLRKGTYPIGGGKVNTYTVCDSCNVQLI